MPSSAKPKVAHPLLTQAVRVDKNCVGLRWFAQDEKHLARLIAIVAMGQALFAANILKNLLPASPAIKDSHLYREATIKLTVQEDGKLPRTGYPQWQRDGFIFEVISWIAARQNQSEMVLLQAPHISATSQGLDGLMIELNASRSKVLSTTVFEDKCTDNPRGTFRDKVMPAFLARHRNERSAEMVATAATLLHSAGIDEASAVGLAAAVMDTGKRSYRAAFALTTEHDSQSQRTKLFKGYEALDGLSKEHRIGAGLIVSGELRDWFDSLATQAIDYLDELLAEGA